jgi:hypothetical protein
MLFAIDSNKTRGEIISLRTILYFNNGFVIMRFYQTLTVDRKFLLIKNHRNKILIILLASQK